MSEGKTFIRELIEKAKKKKARIVFPESSDARIVEAARIMKKEGIAEPVLVAKRKDAAPPVDLKTVFIKDSEKLDEYAEIYLKNTENEELDRDLAMRLVKKPLLFSALMTATGETDAMIGGAQCATGVVILAAKMGVGLKEGLREPSSFFLMVLRDEVPCPQKVLMFADAAVSVEPEAGDLAEIAILTADNVKKLLGIAPRVAFLSFSTKHSARHEHVEKVVEAVKIARQKRPDLKLDGELQFDAAVIPEIAAKKAPDSQVAGEANVLIFPNLDSGNIGYKIAQWAGGAEAIGPIMQGFNKPVNDLSRGASVEDIVTLSAITSLMCREGEERMI